ncbi:hypothetical protein XM48_01030 [Leucobacter sp. Ag1]|nr:hypothetical protein XM48_01030 [Leucobacter sp. Ag1]
MQFTPAGAQMFETVTVVTPESPELSSKPVTSDQPVYMRSLLLGQPAPVSRVTCGVTQVGAEPLIWMPGD